MPATTPKPKSPRPFLTVDDRWAAVVRRDPAADGQFVYSVRTTGVFCRPSCSSRQARRENVGFHATPAEARRAGFRPCRRCRPEAISRDDEQASAVARACREIDDAVNSPGAALPTLAALAAAADLSPFHFHRVFKSVTGLTPKSYAAGRRAQRLRDELPHTGTVTAAIHGAGFNSAGPFYATSDRALGMPPNKFRTGGAGETIRFAVGQTSLGALLVAATPHGLCSIQLGDDPAALVDDLQRRFSRAALIGGDAQFDSWVAQVVALVEAPQLGLNLPLDIRGTAFQQRVWQALTEIPRGAVVTYAELARRLNQPTATRAVAAACAANPLAIAIPCHRVVRAGGALAGYRWGIERKQALLKRESNA